MFWKDHQRQFPALANLARDVLSIPATGAGVGRLFNSARDVCHYRRGSLNPSTIQDLMMFICTSRFEIEDSQRTLINEYLSHEEIQANQEAKSTDAYQLEPISDYDECESDRADEDEIEPVLDPTRMEPSELLPYQPLVNGPSLNADSAGCRRKRKESTKIIVSPASLIHRTGIQAGFGSAQGFLMDMKLLSLYNLYV